MSGAGTPATVGELRSLAESAGLSTAPFDAMSPRSRDDIPAFRWRMSRLRYAYRYTPRWEPYMLQTGRVNFAIAAKYLGIAL